MRAPAYCCLAVISTIAAGAQSRPGADVTFKSTSRLVLVQTTVKGRDGKPIEGLVARDFTISENGVTQAVASCEYQKIGDGSGAPGGAGPAVPDGIAAVGNSEISFGQPGSIRYRDRRLLVLYFDLGSMNNADKYRALDSSLRFVRERMEKSDLLAVMAFSKGVMRVISDFTTDREALARAIGSLTRTQVFDEGAFGQDDEEFNVFRSDRQLSALQSALSILGNLSERKALVYFASGVEFAGPQNQAQMKVVTNAAARANTAIYAVDARGLIATTPMGDASKASPGGIGMYTGATAAAQSTALDQSQDAFYTLSADSGGKAFLDSNDLSLGIVQAQHAFSSYYVLSYYPTNTELDGRFRKITVSLNMNRDAKLEYRDGYFGGKEFGKFNQADRERQLEDALMLGDPITDLTIAVEVNYFQINRAEYYIPVMIKIPGSELVLAHKRGAERTTIDFIGEIKDETNHTIRNIRDMVQLKLSGTTAAKLARSPIEYDCGYTLLPGDYTIKVLARENETGRTGTYAARFVIPNLNKVESEVPISSVVLGSQRVNLRDAIYTTGKDKDQAANPLVQAGQKLIPSVTRVFSQSANLLVYLQAYQQGVPAPHPVVGFVSFYSHGVKAFETPPAEFADVADDRLRATPLRFSIPLGGLRGGRYDCQVTVIDWEGGKAAYWQVPILIVP